MYAIKIYSMSRKKDLLYQTTQNKATNISCRLYDTNIIYEGWNFNSGNYLFTTDTK